MKRVILAGVAFLLILTGCTPSFNNEEEVIEESQNEMTQETAIIPSYSISEEDYQVLLPYKISKARGVIVNQMANRLDIGELEEGLRNHSKEYFSPDEYYFQEGQYLTEDTLYEWLGREEQAENPEQVEKGSETDGGPGLNPPIANPASKEDQLASPKYLSHVLEQNYLTKTDENMVELGGISIGLAMKSVYRFQTEIGGPYYYQGISKSKMLKEGKALAGEIVQRIRNREDIADVPIMVAIYREEDQSSLVPGNFTVKTLVEAGSTAIGDWKTINEENILFPSAEAEEKYKEDADSLAYLEKEVKEFFPNYVGVIGHGFYRDGQLERLTVDIPVQFNGKAEINGFTQYVAGLVSETFPTYYDLEINVTAGEKQESLITREAGQEELNIHIYH